MERLSIQSRSRSNVLLVPMSGLSALLRFSILPILGGENENSVQALVATDTQGLYKPSVRAGRGLVPPR